MKILLVQPSDTDRAMPHLGLGYVAAALEARGDEVRVYDAGIDGGAAEKVRSAIEKFAPDVIGITAQTPYFTKALKVSGLAKSVSPECTVVLGGPHPSILTEETMGESSVDIIVKGEGDRTVVELMDHIERGEEPAGVAGISYRKNGEIFHNDYRPFVEDLDLLPHPAWHLFKMEKYVARMNGRKVAPVLSSRGCPFGCIFCYRGPAAGKRFRARNPGSIVDEIEKLMDRYGVGNILFVDDIFTLRQDRAEKVCDLLIEKDLGVTWRCQTRVDCLNPVLLKKMKQAGCIDISMGIESGSDDMLKAVRKGFTKEKVRQAFKMIKEAGIPTSASFIIGLPEDTTATVRETIEFAKELSPDNAIFYAAMPYPGTELARMVEEKGWKLPEDWDSYRLMSSDAASSKMLAELHISSLSEKELRYFLKTAQIEFQIGRLMAGGETRDAGMRNIIQILRLAVVRRGPFRGLFKFIFRVISDGLLFLRRRIFKK